MALFIKPNKRGAYPERCSIDVEMCSTSPSLGIGEPHLVFKILFPDGKVGSIELPVKESSRLIEKINSVNSSTQNLPPSTLTWAEQILAKLPQS